LTTHYYKKILTTLWYIWKARNDHRFARKTWNTWQVPHAVVAHLSTAALAIPAEDKQVTRTIAPVMQHHNILNTSGQGTTSIFAGNDGAPPITQQAHTNHQSVNTTMQPTHSAEPLANLAIEPPHLGDTVSGMNCSVADFGRSESQTPGSPNPVMHRYIIHQPALLPGVRCYANASTPPGSPSLSSKTAGLGVFFVNAQVQPAQTIYIKAFITGVDSVLMAEAAATTINDRLSFNNTNYLSDCQELVQFLSTLQTSPIHRTGRSNTSLSYLQTSQEDGVHTSTRSVETSIQQLILYPNRHILYLSQL